MLKISKTPLRVSFFGGGTDYPEYFQRYPGAVIGTTINQYIYINALALAGFMDFRYRITWRLSEEAKTVDDIQHPVIREVMRYRGLKGRWNFGIMSDLPGGTGLGSSSAFTVGFINLVSCIEGTRLTRYDLAKQAIMTEHDLLKENVGVQDQIHAAFGGLNRYDFHGDDFTITPIRLTSEAREMLDRAMVLVYTGATRSASDAVAEQVKNTKSKTIDKELSHLLKLVDQSVAVFEQPSPDGMLRELGQMLNDAWQTKRSLSSSISNSQIDEVYDTAMACGAYGGKLCGAGSGGFFLFLADETAQTKMLEKFGGHRFVPVAMDNVGSVIIQD